MEKTATQHVQTSDKMKAYWRRNLGYMVVLLAIWALVSYGFGIVFVVPMNKISIAGFPLGFWFAQQGSIYVFVVEIFVYFVLMQRLDREFDVHE
jgi:putative solute:sodium symporter small subunit